MKPVVQSMTLTSDEHFGRRLPSSAVGRALAEIPAVVRAAVAMAFRGKSGVAGEVPAWLAAASDVRFIGHEGSDATVLHFELPRLGDAAPDLYQPGNAWPTRPDPQDTGFDLWCDILADLEAGNQDSDRFDPALLRRLAHFGRLLGEPFREVLISGRRYPPDRPGRLTPGTLAAARRISAGTPAPRRVRLAGLLHEFRPAAEGLTLRLDDGQHVRGVLPPGHAEGLTPLAGRRVLVLGRAVYRPSGRLLRVDADEVLPSPGGDGFFSAIPAPAPAVPHPRDEGGGREGRRGVGAVIGRWPGDETDEEIEAALKELS